MDWSMTKRGFLGGSLTALGGLLAGCGSSRAEERFEIMKSDAEWRSTLTADRYRILRGHSTERAYSSPLNMEKRHGFFVCAACGQKLFSSETKFESGTGSVARVRSMTRWTTWPRQTE